MVEEKRIQISKDKKDITRSIPKYSIEINRVGKPISGIIPELIELDFRCGKTLKNFRVIAEGEQKPGGSSFKVVNIIKIDKYYQNQKISSNNHKKLDIKVEEIKGIANIQCPHCRGGKSAVIKCGCGGLSCGGGVKEKGNYHYHKCPWCHSVGVIRGHIETLSGEKTTSHEILVTNENRKQSLISTHNPVKQLQSGHRQLQKPR